MRQLRGGGPAAITQDLLTHAAAVALAGKINAYWAARGMQANAYAVRSDATAVLTRADAWVVRSDLGKKLTRKAA